MPQNYSLNGEKIDSLDLKILLITKGINIPPKIHEQFGASHRLSSFMDPQACNCLALPDDTIVHMINVGAHSPFSMDIDEHDKAYIAYNGDFLTSVDFPPKSEFYEQPTSTDRQFKEIAVLQGLDVLSFPYLWNCEYAQNGYSCKFCFPRSYTEQLANNG